MLPRYSSKQSRKFHDATSCRNVSTSSCPVTANKAAMHGNTCVRASNNRSGRRNAAERGHLRAEPGPQVAQQRELPRARSAADHDADLINGVYNEVAFHVVHHRRATT